MKDWRYFKKFERVNGMFLPIRGEGENKAEQVVTAVNKLVYKWYNDGDVFDNTHYLSGWANDLSSYANWLHAHTSAGRILEKVWCCRNDSDYEDLLAQLADKLLDGEDLEVMAREPKVGSIYDCDGPFRFEWLDEEDEDDDY